MDAGKIKVTTIAFAMVTVMAAEVAGRAAVLSGLCSPGAAILGVRLAEAVLLTVVIRLCQGSLAVVGLGKGDIVRGITAGAAWAIVFGGAVAVAGALLLATGADPLPLFRMPLPEGHGELAFFLLAGVVVSPLAEELFFRGLLYGLFRRWGTVAGVILTTIVFAGLHLPGIPIPQAVGGIVFCLAYEKEKSLMAPYVIHALGNAAIFGLGMVS
ncbi:MAG: CPBP family intramembrane glutamic endopeptidase [Thermodesulfobacteriota bacterium]